MKYQPVIVFDRMVFDLKKPIYGGFYGIWDKWLKQAEKKKLKLLIKTDFGFVKFNSVKDYLKGAKKLERFYKNPNEPMIFYGRDLFLDFKNQEKKQEVEEKTGEPIINFEAKKRLLEAWKKVKKYHLTK